MSTVNRWWNFVATVFPCSVLDTVGLDIPLDRLLYIIFRNRRNTEILKVSVRETDIDEFVERLTPLLSDATLLTTLQIFSSNRDGAVRIPLKDLHDVEKFSTSKRLMPETTPGIQTLVLSCDPCGESIRSLLKLTGPSLTSLSFLKGCGRLFKSEEEITEFISHTLRLENIECLYLGSCSSSVDMDPVIARLLAEAGRLRFIQWTNAGASIEMMKSLTGKKGLKCAFEGIGFLYLFAGL